MFWPFLRKHIQWYMDRTRKDRIDSTAAHGAFFIMISFLPFVAMLITLMQQVHFASGLSLIDAALRIFPESVAAYIQSLLPNAVSNGGLIPVTLIASIWSSSMGMVAVIKGMDTIFEVRETRGYIRLRAVAVFYVVIFALVLMITAGLLVFGNTIYHFLLTHSSPFFAWVLGNFKSLAGFLLLFAFFTLMYSCVPRRRVRFRNSLFGAAFSAAGWVLFSFFFSIFVENFSNFSIYGSLATLVILMFWLFFCMYIMFLGAEVSMWLQYSGIQKDLRRLFGRKLGNWEQKGKSSNAQIAPKEKSPKPPAWGNHAPPLVRQNEKANPQKQKKKQQTTTTKR